MASAAVASRVRQILRVTGAATRRAIGDGPDAMVRAARLMSVLEDADTRLAARLSSWAAAHGGDDARFTPRSAQAYRAQCTLVRQYVQRRLEGLTDQAATQAMKASVHETVSLLSELDETFTGIARPLRLAEAAAMDGLVRGTRASLLQTHATSFDRYGAAMTTVIEDRIRGGLARGASMREMVDDLVTMRGPAGTVSMAARQLEDGTVVRLREEQIPEGLFVRYRSWAERIVRTETSRAYNEVRLNSLYYARTQFPDMGKKILAHFDNRTAADSKAVHGQTRKLEEPFLDGAGRSYQHPPARPNDRETVIPWRFSWSEVPSTAPLPTAQLARAIAGATADPGNVSALKRAVAGVRAAELAQAAQTAQAFKSQVGALALESAQTASAQQAIQTEAKAAAQSYAEQQAAAVAKKEAQAAAIAAAEKAAKDLAELKAKKSAAAKKGAETKKAAKLALAEAKKQAELLAAAAKAAAEAAAKKAHDEAVAHACAHPERSRRAR